MTAIGATAGVEVLRCDSCQAVMRPPRLRCPSCGSPGLSRSEVPGNGTVFAMTSSGATGIALVDLAADALRLLAVDPSGALALTVGSPVTLVETDGLLVVHQLRTADG